MLLVLLEPGIGLQLIDAHWWKIVSFKAPIAIAADDKSCDIYFDSYFGGK